MARLGSAVFALLSFVAVAGCGGTSVTQLTGPDQVRCQIGLAASSSSVPAAGAQLSVGIFADRECAWTSRSDATWVQVSATSGQGDGTLNVGVMANVATSSRTANVTINDTIFRVDQAAAVAPPGPPPAPCVYTLSPASRNVNDNGGSRTVQINTGAACPWVAVSSVPWVILTSATSGTGPFTLTYTVTRNTADDDRTGVITVAGQSHLISQDGD